MIDSERMVDDVMWRTGIGERTDADAIVATILESLAGLLTAADARAILAALPDRLAGAFRRGMSGGAVAPAELVERLSVSEDIDVGIATEHARVACSALAENLDPESLTLLAHRLPREWVDWFRPPARETASPSERGVLPGHGHTLATGRPGSQRPLAEASPSTTHSESVARADNPHADTKVSTASALTDDPIATGRAAAEAPIAEARDERSRRSRR
jgi:uncharacterized protein (DUF2267 family)